jgi:hypothetical protein
MAMVTQLMNNGSIVENGQTYTCIDGSQVTPPACYVATSQAEMNQLVSELMSSPTGTITVNGQVYTCVTAGY